MDDIPPEHKHLFPVTDTGETNEQLRRQLARCRENLALVLVIAGMILLPFLLHALGWI